MAVFRKLGYFRQSSYQLKEYSDNDTNTNRLLYINSSDTSGNVTFWFDTRNSDKQLYYTVGSESSLTPVAESVTLTASPETVTAGNSVTLTATAVSPAVNNVTYTFKKTSGGSVNESPNGNTLTVTPTEAGTYKYTVTVSAERLIRLLQAPRLVLQLLLLLHIT